MPVTEPVLEISLSALSQNFKVLKSYISPDTLFLGVVKAYSYGTESAAIAKRLQEEGANYLAVAYSYEGTYLRDQGITLPILVLHPLPEHLSEIIDRCLEPNLYSERLLNKFIEIAEERRQKDYPIHIKFNTGLNRLGFKPEEAEKVVRALKHSRAVKVKSILSHLAASEDPREKDFTQKQIELFKNVADRFMDQYGSKVWMHQSNTSAIFNYPESHFDMVRSGIGLYGYGNDGNYDSLLCPVGRLLAPISQIHTLQKGESIGYNRVSVAERSMRIATIPLGHADGIGRIYGQRKGWVTVGGERAYIEGNVCMDMLMVDVSLSNCHEGDEVEIFGRLTSADELAKKAGTISYELITGISSRVKRRILE